MDRFILNFDIKSGTGISIYSYIKQEYLSANPQTLDEYIKFYGFCLEEAYQRNNEVAKKAYLETAYALFKYFTGKNYESIKIE